MKKINLVFAAILFSVSAFSQKLAVSDVPPQIVNDFKAKFAAAKKVNWEKDKDLIKVEFLNDETKMKVEYLNNAWKKTNYDFKIEYTPQKIKDYVKQYYNLYKIKQVVFSDNNMGERLYEVKIEKKKKDKLLLIFDISSNFLRLGN
jgi:hypothetical protein